MRPPDDDATVRLAPRAAPVPSRRGLGLAVLAGGAAVLAAGGAGLWWWRDPEAPRPAPASTITSWPLATYSRTAVGVSPTRCSPGLISEGTPTRMMLPPKALQS